MFILGVLYETDKIRTKNRQMFGGKGISNLGLRRFEIPPITSVLEPWFVCIYV